MHGITIMKCLQVEDQSLMGEAQVAMKTKLGWNAEVLFAIKAIKVAMVVHPFHERSMLENISEAALNFFINSCFPIPDQ